MCCFVFPGAVRSNVFTSKASEDAINDIIKLWLRTACDRKLSNGSGGRKRRRAEEDSEEVPANRQ